MTLTQEFTLEYLLDELRLEYASSAFELLRSKNQLRRMISTGFQTIMLSVSEYEDVCMIECFLGVRIEDIEEIVLPYTRTSPIFYEDALTIIISYGKYLGKPLKKFKARSVDDLDEIVHILIQFLWKEGMPFFDEYGNVDKMDLLINSDPHTPSNFFFNQENRCLRGITAAKLTQNPKYYDLVFMYEHILEKLPNGSLLLKPYRMLVSHLEEWL